MPYDNYDDLRAGIDEIIASGKDLSSEARGRQLASRNWEIGDAICVHLDATEGKAAYGEGLVTRLASDVNLNKSTIYKIIRFRRFKSKVARSPLLTWSHYLEIIPLKTRKQREFYERAAAREGWSAADLRTRIRDDLYRDAQQGGASEGEQDEPTPSLRPRKGQLYTYRLIRALPGQTDEGDYIVDLGFHGHWPERIVGIDRPRAGMIVTSSKQRSSFRFAANRDRGRKLYTVRALVERVVDGDTIDVRIALGFQRWQSGRLRLRGIDTPELNTAAGRRARDFVDHALRSLPCVVISSSGEDLYGRYLSDLFYLPGCADPATILADGHFLNNQLLQAGLASPYR